MFSTLRTRFGIPGVISVIALVFAMIGGAYAASNGSSDKSATASAKKSAKGPRGPKGAKGATGAAGPAGPAGPAGAKGDAGANGAAGEKGATGDKGANGTNGQSVTTAVEPPFGECGDQEGVELTSASGTDYVCNGEDGADGSPWTAGGTLPVGSTETGAYAISGINGPPFGGLVPISFTIPLAAEISASKVIYVTAITNPDPTNCAGSASSPTAASGFLCVYESIAQTELNQISKPGGIFTEGAGKTGAVLLFKGSEEGAIVAGSWAVTG